MWKRAGALLLATALVACADENPVGIPDLVPGGTVRTVELVLEAPDFLVGDTTVGGFSRLNGAGHLVVARSFEGVLDANALLRFALPPASIKYKDAGGSEVTDEEPRLVDGTLILDVDTARTRLSAPAELRLYRIAEAWDPATASWSFRVDSAPSPRVAWAEPGGTPGPLVGTVVLQPGVASVSFAVDSQTIAAWADTTSQVRGALIATETPGARVRFSSARLHFQARPKTADTPIVQDSVEVASYTSVTNPAADPDGRLLVGGNPSWRTFLRLREGLDTVVVPGLCPEASPCRLRDATVNYAALVLQPLTAPAGFSPADSVAIEVRPVFGGAGAPLTRLIRSPVGTPVANIFYVTPERLAPGAVPVEVPITQVLAELGAPVAGREATRALALVAAPEGWATGTIAFGSPEAGGAAPRLRLILSVINEAQNP